MGASCGGITGPATGGVIAGEGAPWSGAIVAPGVIALDICGIPVPPIAGLFGAGGIGIIPGGSPGIDGMADPEDGPPGAPPPANAAASGLGAGGPYGLTDGPNLDRSI